ncbi:MAG TPA: carboxypeptidase regulatory-like domain-containing protein, partial [Candidatus Wallbacteria bacterium]|nr:carboxypeptidase regulatory-like domain-containing protein [Candidatus Wallbacteria bacterium]
VLSHVAVSAQGQFQTLNLKPGFNFVSFTLSLSSSAADFKKQNPAIEDIYLYSASSGTFLSLGEGSLTSVLPGRGYIIKSASSASIEVSGSVPTSISVPGLKSGFNLIGFSKTPETLTFSQLMARSPILRGLYKWSPVSGVFISVLKNNNGIIEQVSGTDPQIAAGQSYFAYVSSDTTLDYSGSSILIGDGSAVSEPSLTIPASALSDIPMPEQTPGCGNISGEIAPPSDNAAPGGPDRAIKIVSLTNIKVWIKNKPEINARTDENGKFELKNVPAAPEGQGHTIEYEKIEGADKFNGIIKNVPVLEKKKLDLKPYIGPAVIKKAGSIQGRVALYDGLSPVGTDVYIAGVSNMFAKADEDGSFSLMYVPEGTFTIVFSMYGYEIHKKEVSVSANEINQIDRVVLRKLNITSTLGYIDGYVTDSDGMPVPAALASLVSSDSTVDLAVQTTTTGHFKFDGLNGGAYKLIVARDGYKGSETAVKLLTGEEKHVNVTSEKIENSGTGFGLICGYVRDMVTGSPIRNAVVMTIPPTEQFFTDNNGFFSFLIKAGEYTLIIKKAGYIEDRLTFNVPQDQAVEVEGLLENLDTTPVETISLNLSELTMKQGESFQFTATLKDASGANIYGRATSWSASSSQVGRVNFTGLFTAEGPGTCEVSAAYGGKSAKAKINVISTEKRLVSLSLLPGRAGLYVEEIKRFTLKAVYSDSETRVILPSLAEWSCGEGLYMIEKSAFAAVSPGQWLVTAKFNGLEASAAINVIGSLADDKAPRISHKQPQIKAGSPLEMKAEVVDAGGGSVSGVSLYYKKLQDSDFKSVSMVKSTEGVYLYSIPAADITNSGIQYYITAEDDASPAHNKASFPSEGRDNPITLKPLAVIAITLSKYFDKALAGEKYDLGLVSAMVKYSDETSKPVSPAWSLSSGTGTLASKEFVSQTAGTAVLKASYNEGGVSVSANLNISVVTPAFPAPAPNGQYWTAKVYNFNYALKNLPDFSTLPAPVSVFKTSAINVSPRSFDEGFPGTGKDVIENFAIRFTAKLKIQSAGAYTFKLDSDDGSKLYIDGRLVIDNDGIHSTASKTGTVQLDAGEHKTVVEYFQGPRYQIA